MLYTNVIFSNNDKAISINEKGCYLKSGILIHSALVLRNMLFNKMDMTTIHLTNKTPI